MIIKTAQYFIKLYFMNAKVWRGSTYVTAIAATASVACIEATDKIEMKTIFVRQ